MPHRALLVLLLAVAFAAPAAAQPSKLWGRMGEAWDPRGRLPDFSYAGYRSGREPIPDVPVVVNVRDTGAVGDGSSDDSSAFQRAIDRAGEMGGGAVLIPAGTYRLNDQLHLRDSGVVLRGEGRNETILYFTASLADIHGWDLGFANGNNGMIQARGGSFENAGNVAERASRGDRALVLDRDAAEAGIEPGTWLRLTMSADDQSLWDHRHNDQNGSPHTPYCDEVNGELGYWIVRAVAVEGARVELDQPLRTDVRPAWSPKLHRVVGAIEDIGVENLRIEFERTPYPGHHYERGYNAIGFDEGLVANAWIRDVRIRYADNGISLSKAKHVTVRNVKFDGSRASATGYVGHHGTKGGIDCLWEGLSFDANYIHEITLNERTTGTVYSRLSGTVRISLDHHSRAQLENLITELDASYDWAGGGGACSPQAGARHTYWGFSRAMDPPSWSEIQANVVGDLEAGLPERQTANRQWFERLPMLEPRNLYEAQLVRRLLVERRDARFAEGSAGSRAAFRETSPHRWAVADFDGDARYWLATSVHEPPAEGRLGEHAVIDVPPVSDAALSLRARAFETTEHADVAVILGYLDADNYDYALLHASAEQSGLHRVAGGVHTQLAAASAPLLTDAEWHEVRLERESATLTLTVDGAVVASATAEPLGPGLAGVGSLDDSALFDDVVLESPELDPEAPPLGDADAGMRTPDGGTPHAGSTPPPGDAPAIGGGCTVARDGRADVALLLLVLPLLASLRRRRAT